MALRLSCFLLCSSLKSDGSRPWCTFPLGSVFPCFICDSHEAGALDSWGAKSIWGDGSSSGCSWEGLLSAHSQKPPSQGHAP